jgi:hypothetical protein
MPMRTSGWMGSLTTSSLPSLSMQQKASYLRTATRRIPYWDYLLALIHRSAWKVNSSEVRCSNLRAPTLTVDSDALCTKPPKRVATLAIVTISLRTQNTGG